MSIIEDIQKKEEAAAAEIEKSKTEAQNFVEREIIKHEKEVEKLKKDLSLKKESEMEKHRKEMEKLHEEKRKEEEKDIDKLKKEMENKEEEIVQLVVKKAKEKLHGSS